jgi:hypothetical protein
VDVGKGVAVGTLVGVGVLVGILVGVAVGILVGVGDAVIGGRGVLVGARVDVGNAAGPPKAGVEVVFSAAHIPTLLPGPVHLHPNPAQQ